MSLLGIKCPNKDCQKEMLIGQEDEKILCVACHKYFKLIPAEMSVPGLE